VTTYLENLEIREKSGCQKLVRENGQSQGIVKEWSGDWERVEKVREK